MKYSELFKEKIDEEPWKEQKKKERKPRPDKRRRPPRPFDKSQEHTDKLVVNVAESVLEETNTKEVKKEIKSVTFDDKNIIHEITVDKSEIVTEKKRLQAINNMIKALELANSRGKLPIKEAHDVYNSIIILTKPLTNKEIFEAATKAITVLINYIKICSRRGAFDIEESYHFWQSCLSFIE